MKISFDRKSLLNVLPALMCAVSTRSTITAIEGVLIEANEDGSCILTTYDTEKGMRLSVSAKVYSSGRYIINAQKLSQIAKVMEGDEIELTVDDRLVAKIVSGKSSHRMSALAGEDFPELPNIVRDRGFVIPQAKFKKMLAQSVHSMGVDDQRQILNGCYFIVEPGQMTVVSCDSFKLSKCVRHFDIENKSAPGRELNYRFIIPGKTVNELLKLLGDDEDETVEIYCTRKYIVVILGEMTFFSRLIDGEYIDYSRIILPNHKIKAVLDRSSLISALERAALVTEEKIAGSVRSHVKLEFSGDLLKISSSSSAGSTYDEVPIEHEGENVLIAFNNRYLIDSVRACDADTIRLSLSTALMSMNIEPSVREDEDEEIFMLLPVRMKDNA